MNIKKLRFDCHIGQNEMASILGCTQANVSRIENGSRCITGQQIAALIERFGLDVVSRYADPSELPASGPAVTVTLDHSRTEIKDNQGPVNSGSGTQNVGDSSLVEALKAQATVLSNQSDQISKLLDQQARLIALLETAQK